MKRLFHLLIIMLLWVVRVSGQDIHAVFTGTYSGTLTQAGRNSVTLGPDYTYTPNGGTLTVEIQNPIVTGAVTYTSSPVDPETRTLNTSYLVGATKGIFNVDPKGGATYYIPLGMLPGVNGLTQELSLVYSSNTGPGVAGYGWQIAGLSGLNRGQQTFYHDGASKGVELDINDRFYLDGQRLVPSNGYSYGDANALYRTDNDIFTRVTPQLTDANGPGWFRAETKAGLIYEFGNSTESKYKLPDFSPVIGWYVSKIKDLFDNQVNFTYIQDNNCVYVAEIAYGPNKISFDYKTRSDITSTYFKGAKISQRLLIDKISIKYNSVTVKTYEFKYTYQGSSYDSYTYLNEITEYGTGTGRFNSTAFTYQVPADVSFVENPKISHSNINYDSKIVSGDFNGDGKSDLLCIPDPAKGATWTGIKVFFSDGNNYFSTSLSEPINIDIPTLRDIRTLDINADGKDDILMETGTGATSTFKYMLFDATPFSDPVIFSSPTYGTNTGYSCKYRRNTGRQGDDNEQTGGQSSLRTSMTEAKSSRRRTSSTASDYNGDGVNDIFLNDPGGNWSIRSFVNSSGQMTSSLNVLGSGQIASLGREIFSADFNGDGNDDLWSFENSGLNIYSFSGSALNLIFTSTGYSNNLYFNLGDFNADGKVDIFTYGSGKNSTPSDYPYWEMAYSTGTGFERTYITQKKANLYTDYLRLGDFNGDGATDIMLTSGNNPWYGYSIYISQKQGSDLYTYYYNMGNYFTNENLLFADYHGDGHIDFIRTAGTSPYWNGYYLYNTLGNTNILMEKAGDGLGYLVKPTYAKLSNSSSGVYLRGTGAIHPVSDFQGLLTVVSSVDRDNGKGSRNMQNFYYEGAKIHLQGKVFLGFAKMRLTDVTGGIDNEEVIPDGFNPTYFYPSVQLSLSKRSGTTDTISKVKNILSHVVLDATKKWIFPYVSSSKETNKLTGHYVTINTSGYDNYGNPSTIVKSYSSGPTETSTIVYDNTVSSSQWLLGRPTSATIQYTGGGNTITRAVTRSFSTTTNNLNSETWYSGTNNQFVKGYKYNTNGTLKRDSITVSGVYRTNIYTYETNGVRIKTVTDPLSHTTTNTYDSYGRLYTRADYLGNTLTYTYDDMGRETNVSSTDGNQTSTTFAWESPTSTPKPARYSVFKTGNDGSQTKSWLDKLGREIRSDVKGFDGSWIYTDTRYNVKGQVDSISEAYYTGPTWNRYQYDYYGRKTSLTRPSGRNSSWVYSSNTVTETTGGRSFSKTYSSDGTVSSATDAGGTINYTYYPDGKVKNITAPGSIVTQMQYDVAGNQTQLVDPGAGTVTYSYDGFGQLLTQQNARSQTATITYNPNGTVYRKVTPEGTTKYRYNSNKQLTNIGSPGSVSRSFAYDTKGRVTTITDTIPGTTPLITTLTYDTYGRTGTITHPSNIVETKNYNSYGYLSSVSAGGSTRWTTSAMNSRQQVTSGIYGSSLNSTFGYDSYGYLTSSTTGSLQNYTYSFDAVTGNLNWRKNVLQANIQENFEYDNLDRLDRVYRGSTTLLDMAYDSNKGGITTKSDAGTLNYNISAKPYALGTVNPSAGLLPTSVDSLTYTSFESVNTISEGNFAAYFTYNCDNERAKMEVKQSGNTILTRWYPNTGFVRETTGGVTKDYTFLGGDAYTAPVVAITQNSTTTYYNLLRDHLGSITHVVNASNNTLLYEYSYDPWGRMRNVTSWTNYAPGSEPSLFIAGRGFTGHEHLPWFNLINMNGRVYDPLVGQFLSPDNHVQAPYYTQGLNRYVYCLNNPLKYTDPNGERTILGRFFNWIGEQGAKPWVRALISMPTLLSIAPVEVLTMDAMSGGGFVTNYIQGGFSKGFQGVGNYFTISGQMFDTGTETKGWGLRLLSRFTWEGLNTGIGNIAATLTNSSGVVDDIQYYRGATVLKTRGYWGAITFGNNIIGGQSINASRDNSLFQHEYGHYLRSRESGPGYYFEYGIPSLWRAATNPEDYDYFWIERDANKTAFIYFTEQYPGFSDWFYKSNPLFEKGDPRNDDYPIIEYGRRERPSTLTINKN